MKRPKTGKLFLSALMLAAAYAGAAWADPSIKATVSANDISLNDTITLNVEIAGVSNIGTAPTPQIPGFQIQRGGQTQSYQWINGQSSSLLSFSYTLIPVQAGTFTIPVMTLTQDGKSFNTEPIQIVVREGGQAPAAGANQAPNVNNSTPRTVDVPSEGLRPVFMTSQVDYTKAYVGQQLMLTVRFLRKPEVRIASQPRYSEPDLTGFLVEPMKQQEYNTAIQGTPYLVTELKYALFPTSDGEFAVGGANIELAVRAQADPFDPDGFFQNFFGRSQVLKLNTRSIPIQVRSLPKNKPAAFTGAVGRYKISSKVDLNSGEAEVGKPFNLIVTVEGVGNIKALKEPFIPDMSSFRKYESIATSKINNEGKFISGKKEFKILMIPQVSGQISIPTLTYVFFNPESHQYQTETAPAISMNVKPGTLAQAGQDALQPQAPGQLAEGVQVVERDIRFLKTGDITTVKAPFYGRPIFFVINSIPLLFAVGALMARWQNQKKLTHAAHYRSRGALKRSLKILKKAGKLMNENDPVPFFSEIYTALTGFIADKLDISAYGLVWSDVERKLAENNVPQELLLEIRRIWDDADMARFATSSFTVESRPESLAKAETLLKQLDEVLA